MLENYEVIKNLVKMDKQLIFVLVGFVIVLTCVIVGGYLITEDTKKIYVERNKLCGVLLGRECPDYISKEHIDCITNCRILDMDYFRFDYGGFASDECWCLDNNKPKQIW